MISIRVRIINVLFDKIQIIIVCVIMNDLVRIKRLYKIGIKIILDTIKCKYLFRKNKQPKYTTIGRDNSRIVLINTYLMLEKSGKDPKSIFLIC